VVVVTDFCVAAEFYSVENLTMRGVNGEQINSLVRKCFIQEF
jgi:hypothetical protein